MNLKLFSTVFLAVMIAACQQKQEAKAPEFVKVENGHFVKDGKPYYYVGTNFWYGAILGSEGQGGNRERLCKELDLMKEMGIDNLRVLAALRMLREKPQWTIAAIAEECGLGNIRTLQRRVQEVIGMTPAQYRQMFVPEE